MQNCATSDFKNFIVLSFICRIFDEVHGSFLMSIGFFSYLTKVTNAYCVNKSVNVKDVENCAFSIKTLHGCYREDFMKRFWKKEKAERQVVELALTSSPL